MSSQSPDQEQIYNIFDALGPISHQLHNHFNAMVLQVALASRGLSEEQAEQINELRLMALEASRKLSELDQWRYGVTLEREPTDVNAVIEAVLKESKALNSITRCKLKQDLPLCLTHAQELGRLLRLILDCAANVQQKDSEDKEIQIRTTSTGHAIVVLIQDNGPTFPEDRLQDSFDPVRPIREGEQGIARAAAYSLAIRLGISMRLENSTDSKPQVVLELGAINANSSVG